MIIIHSKIHGSKAVEEALRLSKESDKQYIIIPDENIIDQLIENLEDQNSEIADLISMANDVDIEKWINNRKAEVDSDYWNEKEIYGEFENSDDKDMTITLTSNILTGKFLESVCIAEINTNCNWAIPGILSYGGWNSCPNPEEHMAFHKFWSKKFSSKIISISNDVIECVVDNPPSTIEQSNALAWEQYWYCDDIVHQGVETVGRLSGSIINKKSWYFWWD